MGSLDHLDRPFIVHDQRRDDHRLRLDIQRRAEIPCFTIAMVEFYWWRLTSEGKFCYKGQRQGW